MEFIKDFKKYPEWKRKQISGRTREKHPDRIPVIIDRCDVHVPKMDKNKLLVPGSLSMVQFFMEVRKFVHLNDSQALFYFVGPSMLLSSNATVEEQYNRHKSPDGFLYVTYSAENAFGL